MNAKAPMVWDTLGTEDRTAIQAAARQTLNDITRTRVAGQLSEAEFQLLEQGANGEPFDVAELERLMAKVTEVEEAPAQAPARAAGLTASEALKRLSPSPMGTVIERGDRVFVALRKRGPPQGGRSPIFHAVTPYCRMALCRAEPAASSEWVEPPAVVTCRQCLRLLAKL